MLSPSTSPLLAYFQHGFFGRLGGVSTGVYASLNAGIGSLDDPAAVAENRARIAAWFGAAPERLIGLHQVHSARAVRVETPWPGARPEADALVTETAGLALGVLAADCAPVLFADQRAGVIGAAHAGWRGALAGVLEATLTEMEAIGAARASIAAAIGPCIGRASYEVGPEYATRFLDADAANSRFFHASGGDRLLFDLKAYCAARLTAAGVRQIDVLPQDVCALEQEFFSHRRAAKAGQADYGRNASVIML